MQGFVTEAITFLLRWLHVIAAIAWIGESFYFVALDRGLQRPKSASPGLHGESWSVHGGGFYLKQKFLPAPPQLPELLHWSKWKSYTTWLSGLALFVLMYLLDPQLYLLDEAHRDWSPNAAIVAALAFLLAGWLIYDLLCRLFAGHDALLGGMVALLALSMCLLAADWFPGRAAFLLVGATLGTIMSANVFFVIIPGQKRMVAALSAGHSPNPLDGSRGKQRSVHNTYFTLPVVFAMLSTHYAPAFAHPYNALVLALFLLAGALIRQFFVVWHSGERAWGLLAAGAALLFAVLAWLSPMARTGSSSTGDGDEAAAIEVTTAALLPMLQQRCGGCHSAQPKLMPSAPKGVMLDTAAQVEAQIAGIHQQVVVLKVMPPGNLTGMSDEERAMIGRWFSARVDHP